MKALRLVSLVGIISMSLAHAGWAAGHGGGGGGFGGGGHVGGGGGRAGGGFHPGPSGGGFYYSRGMGFGNSAGRFASSQARMPLSRPHVFNGPSRSITNRPITNRSTTNRIVNSRGNATNRAIAPNMGRSGTSARPPLGGRTDHIAEHHDSSWHGDWDRRHAHFDNGRFFVFDNGSWFGLDAGYFPWDYYPYDSYDYYPYDYYPGYYADTEPYYYSEGVYSETPVADPTVSAVQTQLAQQGYYNGPVDGIFGQQTRDAVANYQIAKHLEVTGSLSAQTLQAFGLPQTPQATAG